MPTIESKIIELTKEKYDRMKSEGRKVMGISTVFDPTIPPVWYDSEKFLRGQALSRKFHESVTTSNFNGFLIGVLIPSVLGPFYSSGNSSTIPKIFDRYLSTILYFQEFYTSDPFNPTTKAFKLFKNVRSMHVRVCKLSNQNPAPPDANGILLANQWDMGLVVWSMIGLLVLHPEKYGLYSDFVSETDIEDLNYVWRVMGYCIGLEDRFNICSGTLHEVRALYQLIFQCEFENYMKNLPQEATLSGQWLGSGIGTSLSYAHPFWSWSSSMKRTYEIVGINNVQIPLYTMHDKISYYYSKLLFNVFLKLKITRTIFSWIFNFALGYASKNKEQIKKNLEVKYPEIKFSPPNEDYIKFSYQEIVKMEGQEKNILTLAEECNQDSQFLLLKQCPFFINK